jgi:hypothetical protein
MATRSSSSSAKATAQTGSRLGSGSSEPREHAKVSTLMVRRCGFRSRFRPTEDKLDELAALFKLAEVRLASSCETLEDKSPPGMVTAPRPAAALSIDGFDRFAGFSADSSE